MRFFPLLALSTAILPFVAAAHPSNPLTSYDKRALDVTADACVYVDIEIGIQLGVLQLPGISIKACICLDAVASIASGLKLPVLDVDGKIRAQIQQKLHNYVSKNSKRKTCTYPTNSKPACQSNDVCHWECKPGYVPSTDASGNNICTCAPGTVGCNGKCIKVGKACPSPAPNRLKSRAVCPRGTSVCGVYSKGGKGWECVDTRNDLESCGGCTVPFYPSALPGADCTLISHVADVACVRSKCVVKKCMPGFVVGSDGSSCVDLALSSVNSSYTVVIYDRLPKRDATPANASTFHGRSPTLIGTALLAAQLSGAAVAGVVVDTDVGSSVARNALN
ncbi:Dihydroxyacetone synthase [Tulasnella sp. 403]|nr:Dihydroxyacetone synthase [Tulasnella sp. 403]